MHDAPTYTLKLAVAGSAPSLPCNVHHLMQCNCILMDGQLLALNCIRDLAIFLLMLILEEQHHVSLKSSRTGAEAAGSGMQLPEGVQHRAAAFLPLARLLAGSPLAHLTQPCQSAAGPWQQALPQARSQHSCLLPVRYTACD